MVQRVATDERPFETPSSDESGLGRSDSPSEESEPEAALVSILTHYYNTNETEGVTNRLRFRFYQNVHYFGRTNFRTTMEPFLRV